MVMKLFYFSFFLLNRILLLDSKKNSIPNINFDVSFNHQKSFFEKSILSIFILKKKLCHSYFIYYQSYIIDFLSTNISFVDSKIKLFCIYLTHGIDLTVKVNKSINI